MDCADLVHAVGVDHAVLFRHERLKVHIGNFTFRIGKVLECDENVGQLFVRKVVTEFVKPRPETRSTG